jgi:hypothetical protein
MRGRKKSAARSIKLRKLSGASVGKTTVITQSNYIPWRGYFDLLRSADEVVLLDSVQYTRRDWRNRNQIKTAHGTKWLTIPVEVTGRYLQAIDETRIADPGWAERHIRAIELAYARAACYDSVAPWLFALFRTVAAEPLLTSVNEHLLRVLCDRLGIKVSIRRCSEIFDRELLRNINPTERLVAIAKALSSTRYLSGLAAKTYLNIDLFASAGIEVLWMSYDGYPDYPQPWGEFEPRVSIVDLLLNTGAEAPSYLRKSTI